MNNKLNGAVVIKRCDRGFSIVRRICRTDHVYLLNVVRKITCCETSLFQSVIYFRLTEAIWY